VGGAAGEELAAIVATAGAAEGGLFTLPAMCFVLRIGPGLAERWLGDVQAALQLINSNVTKAKAM
jgi:hypothetical protein